MQDPGFSRSFKGVYKRLINEDGSFNVHRQGTSTSLSNAYHYLINLSWRYFLLLVLVAFLCLNSLFATGYVLIGVDTISGITPGLWYENFAHAFFFSVQTFTTVGYGAMSPLTVGVSMLASFEALVGLMGFAMATGLLYGRFSRPNARLLFSRTAVIAPYKDINALMFRVVNQRSNVMMEMQARVMLVLTDVSESDRKRQFVALDLELDSIHFFPTAWTLVHPIDENSPLKGLDAQDLENKQVELLIQLKGFDDKFSQVVFVRNSYTWDEILVGAKFVPNFTRDEEGIVIVDVEGVHKCERATLN